MQGTKQLIQHSSFKHQTFITRGFKWTHTSLEWTWYVMELNMEEDSQVPSWTANAKNSDKFSTCAVLQSIQKETPNLSSLLHCFLKLLALYLESINLKEPRLIIPLSTSFHDDRTFPSLQHLLCSYSSPYSQLSSMD